MMSLPGLLGVPPHGDGTAVPYLHADPARVAAVRERLALTPARLRVGLAWTGNPMQQNNRRRSIPLAALAPLLSREGIAWYSLMRGDGEDEIARRTGRAVVQLLDERYDFDGKAALVAALDLVVSVCTSSAHLAGALGRPLWVMLSHVPDWRWGNAGTTSAWYPQARVFRQPAPRRLGERGRGDRRGTRRATGMTTTLAPPRSRNDPCPCGSGKRYKHCHGSDAPPADAYVAPDPAARLLEARAHRDPRRPHADAVAMLDAARRRAGHDLAALRLLGEALRPTEPARSRACWLRVLDSAPDDPRRTSSSASSIARPATSKAPSRTSSARSPARPTIRRCSTTSASRSTRPGACPKPRRSSGHARARARCAQPARQSRAEPVPATTLRGGRAAVRPLIERMPTAPVEIWANRGVALRMCAMLPAAEAKELAARDRARARPAEPVARPRRHADRAAALGRGGDRAAPGAASSTRPTATTESMLMHVYGYEAYWKDYPRLRAEIIEAASTRRTIGRNVLR